MNGKMTVGKPAAALLLTLSALLLIAGAVLFFIWKGSPENRSSDAVFVGAQIRKEDNSFCGKDGIEL